MHKYAIVAALAAFVVVDDQVIQSRLEEVAETTLLRVGVAEVAPDETQ